MGTSDPRKGLRREEWLHRVEVVHGERTIWYLYYVFPPWDPGFGPRVGTIPWRRERLPTPVFWPKEFHGLYSPRGHKGSDTTERLSLSLFTLGSNMRKTNPLNWRTGGTTRGLWEARILLGKFANMLYYSQTGQRGWIITSQRWLASIPWLPRLSSAESSDHSCITCFTKHFHTGAKAATVKKNSTLRQAAQAEAASAQSKSSITDSYTGSA